MPLCIGYYLLKQAGITWLIESTKMDIRGGYRRTRYRLGKKMESVGDYLSERFSWQQIDYSQYPFHVEAGKGVDGDTRAACLAVVTDCYCLQKRREQLQDDGTYTGKQMLFKGSHKYKDSDFNYDILIEGNGTIDVVFHSSDGRLKMQVRRALTTAFGKSVIDLPKYQIG